MNFAEALARNAPLLADGATGTMLQNAGLPVGEAPERWTLNNPKAIRDLACSYARAGSHVVYTNTFGANRVRLDRCGLVGKAAELNRRAIALAREGIEAAEVPPVFVAASIGPTGELLEPYGELPPARAREAFTEQAAVVTGECVDAIVCESFADLDEALLCLEAVRSVAHVPVIVSMSFETSGRTMMGVTPENAVSQLYDAGADVVGVNCSVGPEVVERALVAMKAARPNVLLLAKPNAGIPQVVGGRTVYSVTPDAMAAVALRLKKLGVAIIGGCCGNTPDHIAAMANALGKR